MTEPTQPTAPQPTAAAAATTDEEIAKIFKTTVEYITNRMNERQAARLIADALTHMHPTLQQAWWRILRNSMYIYLEEAAFDPRNNASRDFLNEIVGDATTSRAQHVSLPLI